MSADLLMLYVAAEFAHWMAVLPLACLALLARRGQTRDPAWWWLAGAFAVSFLADSWAAALPMNSRWVPSLVYPLAQSVLVGAVLLPRRQALTLLGVLTVAGLSSAFAFGADGPDLTLRSVAWIAVVGIVALDDKLPRRLRVALSAYFGLGLFAWIMFAATELAAPWLLYQAIRLAGLLLFCWAATKPIELRVIRGKITRSHLRARLA